MTAFDHLHIDLSVPPTEDCDDQITIGDERAWLELQSPEQVRAIGARALVAAQHLLNVAYEAREVLRDWGEVPATQRRRVDVIAAVPDLTEDGVTS